MDGGAIAELVPAASARETSDDSEACSAPVAMQPFSCDETAGEQTESLWTVAVAVSPPDGRITPMMTRAVVVPIGRPKAGRPHRAVIANAPASTIKEVEGDMFDDGISEAASMGDDICIAFRMRELDGVMFYVNQLRYQEQQRCRAVTADLWVLYFVMRHPSIHQRWSRAMFRDVAVFLDPHVHEALSRDSSSEESPLDTLRYLFRTALVKKA